MYSVYNRNTCMQNKLHEIFVSKNSLNKIGQYLYAEICYGQLDVNNLR